MKRGTGEPEMQAAAGHKPRVYSNFFGFLGTPEGQKRIKMKPELGHFDHYIAYSFTLTV